MLHGWLASWQRKLIFFPTAPSHLSYARFQPRALGIIVDGIRLQGWHLENLNYPKASALLYFGGNAEDVVHSLDDLASLPARHAFAFNYRGYGLSQGKPQEAALFRDALAVHDQLQQRFHLPSESIHAVGRRLGSAVATHLAARRPLGSVTLLTPLHSVEAIARKMFPWLPVSKLLVDKFRMLENAKVIDAPLLAIIAGRDRLIPNAHSMALYQAWKGPKQKLTISEADHNTVTTFRECHDTISRFLVAREAG
jgi:pimeloyl-ACP methyl ester carboxylesterase